MELVTLSDLFDTRLNSFEKGVIRDEYEKSMYLTTAQDMYYDIILAAFENSNMAAEQLDRLLVTEAITAFETADPYGKVSVILANPARKVLRNKFIYDITSTDPLYKSLSVNVLDIRLSEIQDALKNPFRKPNTDFVLRTIKEVAKVGATPVYTGSTVSLYIADNTVPGSYIVTYGKEPKPILLQDLPDGLEIRGETVATVSTNLEFKDKDLEKIVEIAVSLVLKDAGLFNSQQQQVEK